MTDHTKGGLTILDGDKLYEVIIWNNPVNCYGIVAVSYTHLDVYKRQQQQIIIMMKL